jgi:hypothetical protein
MVKATNERKRKAIKLPVLGKRKEEDQQTDRTTIYKERHGVEGLKKEDMKDRNRW